MKLIKKLNSGFTLVELLVVLAILMVIISITIVSFRSSQLRGHDAQRKSDLKEISNSLELFYSDYSKYPDAINNEIGGCPYNPVTKAGTACAWGSTNAFTDGKTIYFKIIPQDPSSSYSYYYRVVDSPTNQKFQIFAYLENNQDQNCLGGNCANPPVTYQCGSGTCNFALTSPNTTPTE